MFGRPPAPHAGSGRRPHRVIERRVEPAGRPLAPRAGSGRRPHRVIERQVEPAGRPLGPRAEPGRRPHRLVEPQHEVPGRRPRAEYRPRRLHRLVEPQHEAPGRPLGRLDEPHLRRRGRGRKFQTVGAADGRVANVPIRLSQTHQVPLAPRRWRPRHARHVRTSGTATARHRRLAWTARSYAPAARAAVLRPSRSRAAPAARAAPGPHAAGGRLLRCASSCPPGRRRRSGRRRVIPQPGARVRVDSARGSGPMNPAVLRRIHGISILIHVLHGRLGASVRQKCPIFPSASIESPGGGGAMYGPLRSTRTSGC